MRVAEIATALGISGRTVYRLIHDGSLVATRARGQWLVKPTDYEAYLQANTTGKAA